MRTEKFHVRPVIDKLDAIGRADAVAHAVRLGIVHLSASRSCEGCLPTAPLVAAASVAIFWSNPPVGSIMTLALVMLVGPLIRAALGEMRQGRPVIVLPGEQRRMRTS